MVTKFEEFIAEVIGTCVILLFGAGVVACFVLFNDTTVTKVNINIAWGLAVTFGIYASGRISGAHLNPAVTLALAVTKRFPTNKIPHYILGQFVGAFLGAAIVFFVYRDQFMIFDPNLENTAGIFCTFPAVYQHGIFSGMADQILGTFLLVFFILATGDAKNTPVGSNLGPWVVGFLVVAIGMSFGALHGYAINPARDLAPRIFTAIMGFKNNGLTSGNPAWLVPVIGPIIGGILGAVIYDLTIGKSLKKLD